MQEGEQGTQALTAAHRNTPKIWLSWQHLEGEILTRSKRSRI